jgi:yeast amino acid transporter
MSAPAYRPQIGIKQDFSNVPIDAKAEKEYGSPEPLPAAAKQRGLKTRILHSFKRADYTDVHQGYDPESTIPHAGDSSKLHRKLKGRHLQMISIGGAIGAGLFIGSGKALATGGPGAVVLDFGLIGIMLFCTVNALGELATLFPVQGSLFNALFNIRIVYDLFNSLY